MASSFSLSGRGSARAAEAKATRLAITRIRRPRGPLNAFINLVSAPFCALGV